VGVQDLGVQLQELGHGRLAGSGRVLVLVRVVVMIRVLVLVLVRVLVMVFHGRTLRAACAFGIASCV
jgi:hypothetical protein